MKDRIRPRVLLIDDDLDVHEDLAAVLGRKFTFTCVQSAEQGIALVGKSPFSVVLLDIGFPDGMDGHQALEILLQDPLTPPVIMLTGDSRVDSVVRSIKAGAFHYASKRSNPQELGHLIERAVQHHEMTLEIGRLHSELEDARGDLVAVAPASRALLAELEGIADTDVTVLLTGESGTERKSSRGTSMDSARDREGPSSHSTASRCPGT
ncbi:MAG: response regulator [Candidatus Krumholzibacteriia bacterium]